MGSNPMYPAKKDELEALAPVLEVACVESKAKYEKEKMQRRDVLYSDVVGRPYRTCAITSHLQVIQGECSKMLEDVLYCHKRNEHHYGRNCVDVRTALVKCAAKNKIGEFGKNFMA
mmetsp:Transcript_1974/g.4875  ORF Transcript_1974/g.4875 Transcript_1974/m.4875 type:complete len:116 (-) Transcript_1974:152-499(-)|eukprot:CAMPEP_0119561362 /NCGR_PEP_ID=MMETSP1352-20130426/17358_1 /TAXON_ID=265584 /ORGANISM="Stauroneis constricta, Strain CCMP1120" /LENGTH=115 /DNA_ID=CAMNT_0007609543 /DNA_START=17 /DNA_END=364 /DNA_ORIENTATION=+